VGESRNPEGGAVDWTGTVAFSAALFLMVFALIRGNAEDWGAPILAGLAAAAALLVAFVVVERRVEQPMFDLSLFRNPSFCGASLVAFVLSAAMFAMFLYLTLYVQNILGYSALEAGLRFLPITIVSFVVAPFAGKLAERVGVRWFLAAGLALVGVGLLLMRGLEPGDDWTALLSGFLVAGAGIGMTNPALATAAIGVVEPRRSGMASGINSTFRQVGIATGIAAWGAIFQDEVARSFEAGAPAEGWTSHAPREGDVADFVAFGGATRTGDPALARIAEQAFDAGLNEILLLAAIVALVGAALAAVLVRASDFVSTEGAPGA
jgi:Na+/melibiose symporter-like transporter